MRTVREKRRFIDAMVWGLFLGRERRGFRFAGTKSVAEAVEKAVVPLGYRVRKTDATETLEAVRFYNENRSFERGYTVRLTVPVWIAER